MAAPEAAKEAVYLDRFFTEFGEPSPGPVPLSVDNTAAWDLAYPKHHARVKHIERRHFFIREKVENLEIPVPFVRSELNMADFSTKPLAAPQFFRMRNRIIDCSPSSHFCPPRYATGQIRRPPRASPRAAATGA